MRHLAYTVRCPMVPINSSLLTKTLNITHIQIAFSVVSTIFIIINILYNFNNQIDLEII